MIPHELSVLRVERRIVAVAVEEELPPGRVRRLRHSTARRPRRRGRGSPATDATGEVVGGRCAETPTWSRLRASIVWLSTSSSSAPRGSGEAAPRPVAVTDPLADHQCVGVEQQRAPPLEPDRRPEDRIASAGAPRRPPSSGEALELLSAAGACRLTSRHVPRVERRPGSNPQVPGIFAEIPGRWDRRRDRLPPPCSSAGLRPRETR